MKYFKQIFIFILLSVSFSVSAAGYLSKGFFAPNGTDAAFAAVGGPDGAGSMAGYRSDICGDACPSISDIPGGTSNVSGTVWKYVSNVQTFAFILSVCPSPMVEVAGKCIPPPPPCVAGDPTSADVFVGWAVCDENTTACISGSYSQPAQFSDGTCLADTTSLDAGSCGNDTGATAAAPKPITCTLNGTKTGAQAGNEANPVPGTPPTSGTGTGTGTGGTGSGTGGGGTAENPCTVNCGTNPDGSPCTINCTPTPDPGTGTGTGGTGTGGTGTSPTGSQTCGGPGQVACNVSLVAPDGMMNGITAEGNSGPLDTAVQTATDFLNKWGTGDEPGKASQNEFMDIWRDSFDPIPSSGCSSHSVNFGEHVWVFDPCPVASQISDIASYALWIYLFISTVLLVTSKVE